MTETEPDFEPVKTTIAGVDLVTIPVAHYAELLDCQRQLIKAGGDHGGLAHPALVAIDPRSRMFGDPAVAIFLYGALGRSKLKDAHTECVDRFGPDRTPSRATIARYWQRLRR